MKKDFIFTSESVSEGHPDKVADQLSDAVLDAHLAQDPHARVACESLVKDNYVVLAGEITSKARVDYRPLIKATIEKIGYDDPRLGFDSKNFHLSEFLSQQSPDIAQGVDEANNKEQGAGDQGLMFGFACDETPELMPLPISLAHRLVQFLAESRRSGKAPFLKPDAKSQISIQYKEGIPVALDALVISTQHAEHYSLEELDQYIKAEVVPQIIPAQLISKETKYFINPTGRFVVGGPKGDCGLTGRKIIVDTYGGYSRHGGGAFSGKDPSKVDRSAAYAARYIAKNVVAAKLATKCEIQVAYAIGVAKPVAIYVDTFGTGTHTDVALRKAVEKVFDLRPKALIETLQLLKPIYSPTAAYGHFGRQPGKNGEFSWERTDKVEALLKAL